MIPSIDVFRLIAEKILQRKATAEEAQAFWAYMEEQDEEQLKKELFPSEVFHMLPATPAPRKTEDDVLKAILDTKQYQAEVIMLPAKSTIPWKRYSVAAACILFIAGIAALITKITPANNHLALQTWDTIINKQASPKLVMLADQTSVWLNKDAALLVANDYGENRLVQLNGEAFFDVTSKPGLPFRVQTGVITTTVLGTTFNVACVESHYQVSLVSGKVQVSCSLNGGHKVLLAPGETAFANTTGNTVSKAATNVKDIAAWTHGDLVFNQVSLAEALRRVGEKYHTNISISPGLLKGKQVSGVYPHAQSCDQVLTQLLFIYQLQYRKTGSGNIIISS